MTSALSHAEYLLALAERERRGDITTVALGPLAAFTLAEAARFACRHGRMPGFQRDVLAGVAEDLEELFAGTPGERLLTAGRPHNPAGTA